jgi:Tfp pilus assembly protein PilN
MIKVNLLDSVTDRARSAAVVEDRVANPRARMIMLAATVATLMFLGMAFDWISANSAHASAQDELKREEQIKVQMEAVNKEQAELEKKIKDIQARIDVIKKLRAAQQGPVAVLSAINERLPTIADFRLTGIEQKSGELIIEGHSPNESAVTQFGRSLEFSSGLFSNVNIETTRQAVEVSTTDSKGQPVEIDPSAPKPETVSFKVKCKYTAPGSNTAAAPQANSVTTPANQVAQK